APPAAAREGHALAVGEMLLTNGRDRVRRRRRRLGRAPRAAGRDESQESGEPRGNRRHGCTSNCPIMSVGASKARVDRIATYQTLDDPPSTLPASRSE